MIGWRIKIYLMYLTNGMKSVWKRRKQTGFLHTLGELLLWFIWAFQLMRMAYEKEFTNSQKTSAFVDQSLIIVR